MGLMSRIFLQAGDKSVREMGTPGKREQPADPPSPDVDRETRQVSLRGSARGPVETDPPGIDPATGSCVPKPHPVVSL